MKKLFTLSLLCMSLFSMPSFAYDELDSEDYELIPATEARIPAKFWGIWVQFENGKKITSQEAKQICDGTYNNPYTNTWMLEITPNSMTGVGETHTSKITPKYYSKLYPDHIRGSVKVETISSSRKFDEEVDISHEDFEYKVDGSKLYEYIINERGQTEIVGYFYRCP